MEDTTVVPVTFKTFDTEEDFNKYSQSISSKAKSELLNEIGFKSVAEIKGNLNKGTEYDNLTTKYQETLTKYTEIESKYNESLSNQDKLKSDLILTKYNIDDDFKDDFMILAKAKVNEETDLEKASQMVYDKIGKTFFKEGKKPVITIGGEKPLKEETTNEHLKSFRKAVGLKD